jgi:hypothetical protein
MHVADSSVAVSSLFVREMLSIEDVFQLQRSIYKSSYASWYKMRTVAKRKLTAEGRMSGAYPGGMHVENR